MKQTLITVNHSHLPGAKCSLIMTVWSGPVVMTLSTWDWNLDADCRSTARGTEKDMRKLAVSAAVTAWIIQPLVWIPMFDLTLTALSGGAAKSLWGDEYEWAGRGPRQWPKTHTDAHIKETHTYTHTEPQREIMHLLIMGVVRRDRERLMNAFMCSGEISEIHADFAKTFVF